MKKIIPVYISLLICTLFSYLNSEAQVFWTENFTTSTWTMNVITGANDPDYNYFFIGDAEGGGITPNLGAPSSCGVASNGNNTMHVTNTLLGSGATYNAGGLCPIFCVETNRRSESPIINCTGKTNISVNFNYIENGDGVIDNATLWYFDGLNWSQIDDMPKTLTGCSGQGLWTSRTVALPVSANNNPNIKIGFNWTNNDDGVGTDPSFAVDDITLSTPLVTVNTITTNPISSLSLCACQSLSVSFTSTGTYNSGNVYTAQLSDAMGSFASPISIGTLNSTANSGTISTVIPCTSMAGTGYRIRVISSNPAITGTDNGSNLMINQATSPQVYVSTSPLVFCTNTTVYYSATIVNGGTNPTITWKKNGLVVGTGPNYSTTLVSGDVVVCIVVSNAPCANPNIDSTITQFFNVPVAPTVTASAAPSASVCTGEPVTLTGGGALTYTWTNGVTNGVAFTPSGNQIYQVTGVDANGCSNTSTIQVTVNPNVTPPPVTISSSPSIVTIGTPATYTAAVPGSIPVYQLKWYRNNMYFQTTNSPTNFISFTPANMDDSVYAWLIPNGCYNPDSVKSNTITVKYAEGLNTFNIPDGFILYPSPASSVLLIEGVQKGDQYVITDMIGQIVRRKDDCHQDHEQIDVRSLAPGHYLATFKRGNKIWGMKFVKE
ncbi:MAG: T9SS type A sorting domain-containing protein [Chitinophagaceae bacterium]|nr:T9SS type A sorting domain-containing protein [Chitinophagaceae bacterium]